MAMRSCFSGAFLVYVVLSGMANAADMGISCRERPPTRLIGLRISNNRQFNWQRDPVTGNLVAHL